MVARFLLILLTLCLVSTEVDANAFRAWSVGGVLASGCRFSGAGWPNIQNDCLLSSDTTDVISAPRPNSPTFADTFGFGSSQDVLTNGSNFGICDAAFSGATDCSITTQIKVCATPGNITTNTHPWSTEGVVSWQPTGTVGYDPHNSGTYLSGVPAFSPPITIESTAGSIGSAGVSWNWVSYMTAVCGSNLNSYFVDAILGDMPNLRAATVSMGSNDTLTVAAPPAGFPYWPTSENSIGSNGNGTSPPSNLTLTFATGASFGYPNPNDKGFLLVQNNGTTINGGTCFWVNPSNNQACIAWVSGLDLTVNGFYGDTAGMGLFRATVRQGITNFINDTFANMGCMDGACAYGHNHSIYLGTVPSAGFDELIATNLNDPDVLENGWNIKLRTPNSSITQSFLGARVNNGTSSSHGPIDYPCAGTHSVTYSALETNQYSFNLGISNQSSTFLVSSGEEGATNIATTPTSAVLGGTNCPMIVGVPSSTAISATIIDNQTFTTTTNPASFVPLLFYGGGGASMWDGGVSGMLLNGPTPVNSWTGPVGGIYTVTVGPCFNGEGTIPLAHPGYTIYSCFVGTGAVTLYALGAVSSLPTNTSTTASLSVPLNPAVFGFVVGDTLIDNSNALSVTSITGSGPYTINMSCAHPTFDGGGNCLLPAANNSVSSDPVASGTYNSGTGAVSLVLGADVGLTNGSSFTLSNLYGTGSISSLNGTWTATAGTTGTTLNFTGPTGLTLTIGASNNGVSNPNFPANSALMEKVGPVQLVASTTGSGCDGVNLLCGITYDPRGAVRLARTSGSRHWYLNWLWLHGRGTDPQHSALWWRNR